MFVRMVFCSSNVKNCLVSLSLPAKYGGMCPAPGLNGFVMFIALIFILNYLVD